MNIKYLFYLHVRSFEIFSFLEICVFFCQQLLKCNFCVYAGTSNTNVSDYKIVLLCIDSSVYDTHSLSLSLSHTHTHTHTHEGERVAKTGLSCSVRERLCKGATLR